MVSKAILTLPKSVRYWQTCGWHRVRVTTSLIMARGMATAEAIATNYNRNPSSLSAFPAEIFSNRRDHKASVDSAPSKNHSALKRPVGTMPPGYNATVGQLKTFVLPGTVTGESRDIELGKAIVRAFQTDGILQITMTPEQWKIYSEAEMASKRFFNKSHIQKAACVDSQSYAGYIASGEEITDGIADYSEIFTVTKDLALDDVRVLDKWPCHGPTPWPDVEFRNPIKEYMTYLGKSGEKLLDLLELGLNVPKGSLSNLTEDGWHHLRVLRFPATDKTNGKGEEGRGIGSHTDYGLLVIAAQDEVGGLFIRPPYRDESYANWKDSAAGKFEHDDKWVYVPPQEGVFTVFPGDMMQYMTNSALPSTPHKVGLNTGERFAFAYFHEPSFQSTIKPLPGYDAGQEPVEGVHYGTHFTNMFLRNYPDRITSERMAEENRYDLLKTRALREPVAIV